MPFYLYMEDIQKHEKYMHLAIKEAIKAAEMDEVPIGAVIVKDDKVIAKAHNLKEKHNQATHHAEILAIQKASKKLGTWYLKDCDLYVTLEPCMMCMGASVLSRVRHIYYGTDDPKGGAIQSVISFIEIKRLNHYPEATPYILKDECSKLLKDFFKMKREQKKLMK